MWLKRSSAGECCDCASMPEPCECIDDYCYVDAEGRYGIAVTNKVCYFTDYSQTTIGDWTLSPRRWFREVSAHGEYNFADTRAGGATGDYSRAYSASVTGARSDTCQPVGGSVLEPDVAPEGAWSESNTSPPGTYSGTDHYKKFVSWGVLISDTGAYSVADIFGDTEGDAGDAMESEIIPAMTLAFTREDGCIVYAAGEIDAGSQTVGPHTFDWSGVGYLGGTHTWSYDWLQKVEFCDEYLTEELLVEALLESPEWLLWHSIGAISSSYELSHGNDVGNLALAQYRFNYTPVPGRVMRIHYKIDGVAQIVDDPLSTVYDLAVEPDGTGHTFEYVSCELLPP